MNRTEFRDVFLTWTQTPQGLEMLTDLGIGHYNSPWARTLQIALTVAEPLSARITTLEAQLVAMSATAGLQPHSALQAAEPVAANETPPEPPAATPAALVPIGKRRSRRRG